MSLGLKGLRTSCTGPLCLSVFHVFDFAFYYSNMHTCVLFLKENIDPLLTLTGDRSSSLKELALQTRNNL